MTSFFYIESRFISVSGFSVCFHCFDTMWVIFVRSVLGVFLVFKVVVISLTSSQFVLFWRHILLFLLSLVFSEVILFLSCIIRDMSFEGNNTPTQLIVAPCTQSFNIWMGIRTLFSTFCLCQLQLHSHAIFSRHSSMDCDVIYSLCFLYIT